jgi:hypothetical protein
MGVGEVMEAGPWATELGRCCGRPSGGLRCPSPRVATTWVKRAQIHRAPPCYTLSTPPRSPGSDHRTLRSDFSSSRLFSACMDSQTAKLPVVSPPSDLGVVMPLPGRGHCAWGGVGAGIKPAVQ